MLKLKLWSDASSESARFSEFDHSALQISVCSERGNNINSEYATHEKSEVLGNFIKWEKCHFQFSSLWTKKRTAYNQNESYMKSNEFCRYNKNVWKNQRQQELMISKVDLSSTSQRNVSNVDISVDTCKCNSKEQSQSERRNQRCWISASLWTLSSYRLKLTSPVKWSSAQGGKGSKLYK